MKNKLLLAFCLAFAFAQMTWAGSKYFFVMIPPEFEEWMSSVPMLSMDGGVTGKPMTAVQDMCGWYSFEFADGEPITDNVVLYRDDDIEREDMIGMHGNWETSTSATPIPLGMFFGAMETNGQDTLFFVPDEEQKTNDDGFYYSAAEVDGIEGTCEYTMASIIYDTDASLHGAFTCYPTWHNGMTEAEGKMNDCYYATAPYNVVSSATGEVPCIGVTKGMVNEILGSSKKPELTTKGKSCFSSQAEKAFAAMFNYTPGVNEKTCFDMPFRRNGNGLWGFNSDTYTGYGLTVQGGFYPVENKSDAMVLMADPSQKILSNARTKRRAEGPIFYSSDLRAINATERVPEFNLLCNGPAWKNGIECEGLFFDADETAAAIRNHFNMEKSACVFGWSCSVDAPAGWKFYVDGTETLSTTSSSPQWVSKTGRNQHFCSESHAKFTYKPGLRFSIRGDDDIWVYIDDQLAIDLGGTHMAAPGYVDFENFKGASGTLEVGNQYDIDIFFCDRRTTVSTMDIQTNMYIQQRTDIQVKGKKNPQNPAEKVYELCYTKSGDGSCAAAMTDSDEEISCCGDDFKTKPGCTGVSPKFKLVKGKKITDPVVEQFADMEAGKKYACDAIDLTNPAKPVVNSDEVCLGAGRYTLFVTINGKSRKIQSFTPVGDLDVVYKDAKAVYIDEEDSKYDKILGEYHLTNTEMGGKYVPIYISNVGDYDGEVVIQPALAAGVSYALDFDAKMKVLYKDAEGYYHPVSSGEARTIGESGVDTLYVTVEMDDLKETLQEFSIKVAGRSNAQKINFYLPVISFVSAPDSTAKLVTGQKPNDDGTYEEWWVGSIYDLYLAILKPSVGSDGKVKYYTCKEDCEGIEIHKGAETSLGIDFIPETVSFHDGYATISVRSLKEYRWDMDPAIHSPAVIVAGYNDYVKAVYSPIYFRSTPTPFPVLADVFDVRGAKPSKVLKMPEPYFSMDREYLDGIGDSVAIYYNHSLHKDSLPNRICILWDSTSAEEHNPVVEGFSNISKDTSIFCNALVKPGQMKIDCSSMDTYGYCSNVVTVGGLTLSKDVKTQGVGKVYSYTIFKDKGKDVKQGFVGALTDRIAPIPLRASVRSIRRDDELSDYDSLIVVFSEPVDLVTIDYRKSSLDFFLNASELPEDQRYASALSGSFVVRAEVDPAILADNGKGRAKFIYKRSIATPHKGDYLRMGGDMHNVFWSDVANTSDSDDNHLRSIADAAYHWNAPTGFDEVVRLPSPWIVIESVDLPPEEKQDENENEKEEENGGEKKVDPEERKYKDEWLDEDGKLIFAEPTFRIKMVGPFQFKIVMDEFVSERATKYAVMDLQGRVLRKGDIRTAETNVPVLSSGTYIVKVGLGTRRVNVR